MDIESIIKNVLSNGSASSAIADKTGLSKDQVDQAVSIGLPMIFGGMAKNASDPTGASSLDKALGSHEDSAVVQDPSLATKDDVQKDGAGILGHIFGSGTGSISDVIAKKINADPAQVQKALAILAPIALGYLATHKKQKKLDADGVADTLKQTQSTESNPMSDLIQSALGSLFGGAKR